MMRDTKAAILRARAVNPIAPLPPQLYAPLLFPRGVSWVAPLYRRSAVPHVSLCPPRFEESCDVPAPTCRCYGGSVLLSGDAPPKPET